MPKKTKTTLILNKILNLFKINEGFLSSSHLIIKSLWIRFNYCQYLKKSNKNNSMLEILFINPLKEIIVIKI